MHDQFQTTYISPIGFIQIKGNGIGITEILFAESKLNDTFNNPSFFHIAKTQLTEYFSGDRRAFELPLIPEGTNFQQSVWNKLIHIPFGKTISYASLAIQTGDIKNVRAVGGANGKNPISIVIPCHRVIGADGKLVGYSGELWRKQWLLDFERAKMHGILKLFPD